MFKAITIVQLIIISSIIINAQSFREIATQYNLKTPNGNVVHDISRSHLHNYNKSVFQGEYGRPTEFVEQQWNTGQARWENNWRFVNEYAPEYAGQMCGVNRNYPGISIYSSYDWSGTDWENPSVTTSTYDSNWNMTGWTRTKPNGDPHSDGTLTGPYCCGNPTQEILRIWNGSIMENAYRYSNTFSLDCDWTIEQRDSWDGFEWIPNILLEVTWVQPGCPDSLTYSYWDNGEWIVNYREIYAYGNPDCMNDQVPYSPWYLYSCNPTSVDTYWSSDNGDIWNLESHEEFHLNDDCLTTSQNYYPPDGYIPSTQPNRMITNEFGVISPSGGKTLEILDNTDKRLTKSVTQVYSDGVWVNSWRVWYSYEGMHLNTDNDLSLPNRYLLDQNYPNPFNPYTTILYELPEKVKVSVVIYDFLGREVRNLVNNIEQPGSHSINWNGKDGSGNDVSAGIYLYQIRAGGYVETKKMVLLK